MTGKRVTLDIDDLSRRYLAGESTVALAQSVGCSTATVQARLTAAGVQMRTFREAMLLDRGVTVDEADLRDRYARGESVLAMSKALGISRMTLMRRLTDLGLELRSGREANLIRMAALTDEERQELAAAANQSRRTRDIAAAIPVRSLRGHRQAVGGSYARSRLVGKGEPELFDLLLARRLRVEVQVPVYGYNLDLAVETVAVEVWWGHSYPFRAPRLVRRTVELADLGWSTIFVWCSGRPIEAGAVDAVIALVKEARRRPPSVRPEYRVVRSDGQLVTAGKAQLDDVALIPTPRHGS